jgi:ATP-binding cassette subfamily B multidrug efflux pump
MFNVLSKLSWFFRLHWIRYTVAIVLLVVAGGLEILPPKLIGVAIDDIYLGTLTAERLTGYLLQLTSLMIVIYLITYIWMYQLFGGAFLVERTLRSRFMRHLIKMTPTFYEKHRTGDLMAQATNDLRAVSVTAGFGILTLVDSSVFMIIILFAMGFMISWKLTFAALIPLPLMAIAMNRYGKVVHERFMKAQDAFGEMNDQVLEYIAGVRVVRAYVQERSTGQRFQEKTEDVYLKNVSVAKIDALFEPTIKVLVGVSYLIGLGYGAHLVYQNQITLGELITFNVYLGMMIWPMFAVGELINVLQRGNASLDRVNETLAYPADVINNEVLSEVEEPGAIAFKGVSFRYPSSDMDNLKEISFYIEPGETLGIVGRTGSGKTTLLKQLLREYPLGTGEISISNVPIQHIALDQLQKWIGYVPQDQMLFSRTVRENIVFGLKEASDEQVEQALEWASFRKDIEVLPEGLNTLVGEKGVALSGGQKQRVSIARALICNPEILLLDDSLSAVDAKTEADIIGHIRREREGKTTIITTHRMSAVQHADWIIVLEEGAIVEKGTHEQLMSLKKGWYREQYERQQVEAQLAAGKG